MTPFPWADAMQFGFGILRLSPAAFWAMTPRELSAAHNALNRTNPPLDKWRLGEMMQKFPDQKNSNPEPENG